MTTKLYNSLNFKSKSWWVLFMFFGQISAIAFILLLPVIGYCITLDISENVSDNRHLPIWICINTIFYSFMISAMCYKESIKCDVRIQGFNERKKSNKFYSKMVTISQSQLKMSNVTTYIKWTYPPGTIEEFIQPYTFTGFSKDRCEYRKSVFVRNTRKQTIDSVYDLWDEICGLYV